MPESRMTGYEYFTIYFSEIFRYDKEKKKREKRKSMKKQLLFAICLLLLAFFTACQKQEEPFMSKKAIETALSQLMPQAEEIERIFYKEGLATKEMRSPLSGENGHTFAPVIEENFKSIADIKKATEQVFTPDYAESTYYSGGLSGEYARYQEIDGVLCKDLDQDGSGKLKWLTDRFLITEQTENTVTVTMQNVDANGDEETGMVTLIYTEEGWRISMRNPWFAEDSVIQ